MSKDFYFNMLFKEWLVSTADWSASARGWYINLLCHQADKGCLPNDIESLAQLAGVKFSEFEEFKGCFKHTLSKKFKQNEKGRLVNKDLDKQLVTRNEYKEKQSKRGKIGAFIKKKRQEHDLKKDQWNQISRELSEIDFNDKSDNEIEKELSIRFKHTLKAFIEDDVEDDNNNKYSKEVEIVFEKIKPLFELEFPEDSTKDMIDKLMRIDGWKGNDIVNICRNTRNHDFWHQNFLSPLKLRRKNKDEIYYIEVFSKLKKPKKQSQIIELQAGRR